MIFDKLVEGDGFSADYFFYRIGCFVGETLYDAVVQADHQVYDEGWELYFFHCSLLVIPVLSHERGLVHYAFCIGLKCSRCN